MNSFTKIKKKKILKRNHPQDKKLKSWKVKGKRKERDNMKTKEASISPNYNNNNGLIIIHRVVPIKFLVDVYNSNVPIHLCFNSGVMNGDQSLIS